MCIRDSWQRTHEVINGNLFCNIDIWDDEKKTWVDVYKRQTKRSDITTLFFFLLAAGRCFLSRPEMCIRDRRINRPLAK